MNDNQDPLAQGAVPQPPVAPTTLPQPIVGQLESVQPVADQQTVPQPPTEQPEVVQPAMEQLMAEHLASEQPIVEQQTTAQPAFAQNPQPMADPLAQPIVKSGKPLGKGAKMAIIFSGVGAVVVALVVVFFTTSGFGLLNNRSVENFCKKSRAVEQWAEDTGYDFSFDDLKGSGEKKTKAEKYLELARDAANAIPDDDLRDYTNDMLDAMAEGDTKALMSLMLQADEKAMTEMTEKCEVINGDSSASDNDNQTSGNGSSNSECDNESHCGTAKYTPTKSGYYKYSVTRDVSGILIDGKIKVSLDAKTCSTMDPGDEFDEYSYTNGSNGTLQEVMRLVSYSPLKDNYIDDGCDEYVGNDKLISYVVPYVHLYNDMTTFKSEENIDEQYKLKNDKDGNTIYLETGGSQFTHWRVITLGNGSVLAIETSVGTDSTVGVALSDDEIEERLQPVTLDMADKIYQAMTIKN